MRCQKCHFECDREDTFCRKCGTALVHEASFNELDAAGSEQVVTAEVTTLQVAQPALLAVAKPGKLTRLTEMLKSEQGKKLARGAALVAVGVGIELAAQALGKKGQSQTALARPASSGTALSLSSENSANKPAAPSGPIVWESVTYQRIQSRTVWRRTQ